MRRDAETPALSVLIITPDSFDTVRQTVRCLTRQTVRDRIELLILAPRDARVTVDATLVAPLFDTRVIEVEAVSPTGPVRAAGVRAARAPIVALAEEHCFPAPEWAAALLRAHEKDYAAVGPAIRNANPETLVSWADLYMGYGPWVAPATPGEMDFLPGHNSSYKRELLLSYGDALDELFEAETVLQWDLRKKGHRLFLEPAALAAHTNFGFWSSWLPVTYYNGRAFAATRASNWPRLRKLAYAAASPLIPLVRLVRALGQARRSGRPVSFLLRMAPVLAVGLTCDAAGQFAGYLLGGGDAHERMAAYEWHRLRHTPRGRAGSANDEMGFSNEAAR